jgi:hypothetical protein
VRSLHTLGHGAINVHPARIRDRGGGSRDGIGVVHSLLGILVNPVGQGHGFGYINSEGRV